MEGLNQGSRTMDLTGQRFGFLEVISFAGYRGHPRARPCWLCRCDCGVEKEITSPGLRIGTTVSCGCFAKRNNAEKQRTHGKTKTKEFGTWIAIMSRCHNPKSDKYAGYGARGIKVCDRWRDSFVAFLADMGEAPSPSHSIDRIDNDGDYEPGNCRWATKVEQARNRRTNRVIEFRGESRTLSEWAEHLGASRWIVGQRLKMGWSVEDALTKPIIRYRRKPAEA